jgi:hypothetical protein
MKHFLIALLTILTVGLGVAQQKSFDFRKVNWGMSQKQVKATEVGKVHDEDYETVLYKGTVSGMDVTIMYKFTNSQLTQCAYFFDIEHSNKNSYIDDYKRVRKSLVDKYGEPKMSNELVWYNELFKDDPSQWGLAVSAGHCTYLTSWETTTTNIRLVLHGDNYKITLGATYGSKQFKSLVEDAEKKKDAGNF